MTAEPADDPRIHARLQAAFAGALEGDERLRGRLATLAEQRGLLDVAYRTVDSPIGPLLLAATRAGIVRVAFEREDHNAVLARLAEEVSPRILRSSRRLDEASRQLAAYFAGRRRAFAVPLDLSLARGFRRSVIVRLGEIPYGVTRSYAAVARAAGKPTAIRAAASACAHNPLPLFLPCHRVVRSDGAIGDYRGGPEAKRTLLALESGA